MVTIGRIPGCLRSFFRPQRDRFSKRSWPHFWGLVTAMAMGTEQTVERLNALLRGHGHRTNDGEFLWRSRFDEVGVLQGIALRLLNRVYRSGEPIYFILDDTQTLKRAKKMDAVGKLFGFIQGEIYIARREIFSSDLTFYSDGSLWGSVTDDSEQLVIGASLAILNTPNNPPQRRDPGLNPVILIPVSADLDTCEELMANRDALFPPEPRF